MARIVGRMIPMLAGVLAARASTAVNLLSIVMFLGVLLLNLTIVIQVLRRRDPIDRIDAFDASDTSETWTAPASA